ncbi:SDR family NAD(P)-dependent oxidoreductase [Pectobacterium versatile]|nr:SDR family NAD(P)-dependent oxidoreductase [Pectobacterium versatile]
MYNVKNKVIVITGASSGLGEATARLLASEGAKVVLGARRTDKLNTLVSEINHSGGTAVCVTTDVKNRDDVKNLIDTAVEKFGRIDVLLNNAGLMPLAPFELLKVDEWNETIDVNIKGVLHGIAGALPHMQSQKSGHIINVSSVYGHIVGQGAGVYCGTKWAVRAISEALRQEVKPYNLRTTIISPGASQTELHEHTSQQDIKDNVKKAVDDFGLSPDAFARMVAFAISQPEDVDISEILFRPTSQQQ